MASGRGPSSSSEIVYLLITDDSYQYFKKNTLDRKDLAGINRALSALEPEAVAYDIIFARESSPGAGLHSVYRCLGNRFQKDGSPCIGEVF